MRGADGITVAAGRQDARQQRVEVLPVSFGAGRIEDSQPFHITIAIELRDPLAAEHLGSRDLTGIEPQVAFHLSEFVLFRQDFETRSGSHGVSVSKFVEKRDSNRVSTIPEEAAIQRFFKDFRG